MKEYVSRIKSLLIFDFPSKTYAIRETFLAIHGNSQKEFAHWNLAATRKKIVAQFWLTEVVLNFGLILLLANLIILPFQGKWIFVFPAILIGGPICFLTLLIFNYGPGFFSQFLPALEMIIAEQEKNLAAETEIKKCKRSQFSIPTLTIIFYVFAKASKLPMPAANDKSAELLNNLYGADRDKLKQNLSRLCKIAGLTPKERAEMVKGIETSRAFFQFLDFPAAQNILDNLELKLQNAGPQFLKS